MSISALSRALPLLLALGLGLAGPALAHGDHSHVEDGQATSPEPMDGILWTHIILMGFAFGIVFPLGMVLGMIRSRWHVPVQTVGSVIAFVAYFLGHAHKGRQFAKNVHASFANVLMLLLIVQILLGAYLKLHLEKGFQGRIRRYFVLLHGIVGKAMPLISWIQIVFGSITAWGFCRGDHLGQCLAHFIMGSAFIAYGILLTILLLVGQFWLRRTGRSQEFFDSTVIAVWGCFNTFTEHRWGTKWVKNDLQHTTMGIVWWAAGLLGMFLSRKRNGQPKRNLIPAIVIGLTGWAMGGHPQALHISEAVHTVFGYCLMAAGAARIIEISFVLSDRATVSPDGSDPHSFQYVTPFMLCASGFMFMGATEEQMVFLHNNNVTHVAYILILFSCAFVLFLFVNILLHIYAVHSWPKSADYDPSHPAHTRTHDDLDFDNAVALHDLRDHRAAAGNANSNGHGNGNRAASLETGHQLRDAQEFELEGLIGSDDRGLDFDEDDLGEPGPTQRQKDLEAARDAGVLR